MTFAVYVGVGASVRVSVDVRQDDSKDMVMGMRAPVTTITVAAVDFVVELASLTAAAYTT